jgi:hypothetical protein
MEHPEFPPINAASLPHYAPLSDRVQQHLVLDVRKRCFRPDAVAAFLGTLTDLPDLAWTPDPARCARALPDVGFVSKFVQGLVLCPLKPR